MLGQEHRVPIVLLLILIVSVSGELPVHEGTRARPRGALCYLDVSFLLELIIFLYDKFIRFFLQNIDHCEPLRAHCVAGDPV
jgi:hypothetical protein